MLTPSAFRAPASVAIVIESTIYLVDCPNGVAGQLAKAGLSENFTLLHQGEDPEHNTATALYEYLTELSAHLSGE